MVKFSIKKPLTVFVAVIAVIVLGVVAYLGMTPDLLPNMNFPYVIIVTTYPGASPEKVEEELTKPLEQAMSTLEDIKEVSSTSGENYSMVMLEFEESVNMDTIGVDIQQSISTLQSGWDEMVSAPYVLKINPSMLPVQIAAVSMDGMDNVELTEFLDEELIYKLEGISGVARVSTSGTIRQELHLVLDQKKIDELNQKISDAINGKMDDALEDLNKTKQELEDAQAQMDSGKDQMEAGKDTLIGQTAAGEAELSHQQAQLLATRSDLQTQLAQLQSAKSQLETTLTVLKSLQSAMDSLSGEESSLAKDLENLKSMKVRAGDIKVRQAAFDAQIEAIRASGKTPEEIDAEIAALQASPAYIQLEADKATLAAEMTAYNVTEETLDQRISLTETTLNEINTRVEQLEQLLVQQGVDVEQLDATVKEMESNMEQLDAGMVAIQDGIKQIDDGMLQLKDAQKLLSEQKTSGILEIAAGATEMSVGAATVTNALTQIEGGIDTLETTREQTLEQADLNNILTMDMISSILTAQNFFMPAGTISDEGVSYMVSVGEKLTTAQELEELLLFDMGMEGVEPIYLKDLAAVLVTDNAGDSYTKLDGLDSIVLTFEKQSTYATAETTNNILARFAELENEYQGLHFVSLMNQGDYIYLIVDTITSSLLLGALFAIIILFLFLKDLRPTIITLISIPVSVVFAIVLMYFSGVTINMISLSGLAVAVGMLVDNSVVVIENIYRLRSKGANAIQAAASGAQQVAGAVTASTLTTVCVFAPIVFVQGITRQLFTDLALTMTYALMASLIVSLTLVPAMASGMLTGKKESKDFLMPLLQGGYQIAVNWALNHKLIVLLVSAALLVGSAVWSLARGFIFMPTMDMPNVNVTIEMPEDATTEEAFALADEVLKRIDTIEGIEAAGATMSSGGMLGMGSIGGMGGTSDSKDVTVYITLSDDSASGAAVGKQIEALCADMECTVSATSAILDMSMLSGSGITLQIYSGDMETLQNAARKAGQILSELDGVAEVTDGLEDAAPALHVLVDRNKAMAKGITVAQVYMEIASALRTSVTSTSLDLDGTTTSVIVEPPEDTLVKVETLAELPFTVTTQTGQTNEFTLSDIATIEETTSLNSISRLSQRRYLSVSATLEEGKNITLVTAQAEAAIRNADLGEGVTYAFTGENETIMEAIEQLALMLLLGVLLVYLVMVAQFQSLKSPFIVMFTIPLAFTGGFIALLIGGLELSVISMIGFIMLTGIIVNNGIVLVDYINQLRQEGAEIRDAILEAGATRMRPILMTTITTILGLIDMALRQNVGTSLMQPVAVVCIGGLVYATLMTLFVVPCIYELLNKGQLRKVDEADLEILDI